MTTSFPLIILYAFQTRQDEPHEIQNATAGNHRRENKTQSFQMVVKKTTPFTNLHIFAWSCSKLSFAFLQT